MLIALHTLGVSKREGWVVVGSILSKRWISNCLRAIPAWGLRLVALRRVVDERGWRAGRVADDCLVREMAWRFSSEAVLAARAQDPLVGLGVLRLRVRWAMCFGWGCCALANRLATL